MEHLRYNVTDELEYSRETSLFSYPMIGIFLAGIVLVLIYLFPGQSITNTLLNQSYITSADFHYSLLLLGNEHIDFSEIHSNPMSVLDELAKEPDNFKQNQQFDKLLFNYIVLKSIALSPKSDAAVKQRANQLMLTYLDLFKQQPTSAQQDKLLAEDALAINQAGYALYFYEQILKKAPEQDVYFYTRAAQVALWAKECVKSADFYFTAQHKSEALKDKRYLYFMALKTLVQCNESSRAIDMADMNIDGLSEDVETYQLLIDIAIQANQPSMAQTYLIKMLQLKSEQDKAAKNNSAK